MKNTQKETAKAIALSYYDNNIEALLADVDAAGGSVNFIQGGGLAIPYDTQREELAEIYEQTEAQAAKYTNEQVFNTYVYVMSQAIALLRVA